MNEFGRIFKVTIFGESHGNGVGITIDGCPCGIPLTAEDFVKDISKRKPSQRGTTPRKEADIPELLSGTFNKHTTGAPITIWFANQNTRPSDYEKDKKHFRPGHADFTAWKKYNGYNDYRGGGHFSGRLTLGLVAAGVVAKKIIPQITITAQIKEIGGKNDFSTILEQSIQEGNSLGGVIACTATHVPTALGEPFFDSVESVISHLAFSIPGIRAIAFGDGFLSAHQKGSEHNDCYTNIHGHTSTNHCGGINGGITNGNPLYFELTVKPTSSISLPQKTFHFDNETISPLATQGRHDACIALRIPIVAESITAIALADFFLLQKRNKAEI